jgi:lipopolysaccharide transport system ATP-binding protein
MSEIVIKAENIGKKYVIGHQSVSGAQTTFREVLMQNARTLWNKTKDLATGNAIIQGDTMEEVWALKDVNFEIQRGEAVGIIGSNGAGKSTLLKILSRITEPTTGRVTIKGRVASLLEVGTGFHPELSGRENIYLNGTILGMTRVEIKQKFDEIIAFAEVEKYLDTPVKRYSSGMYVRLAFAVAAHLEPEILVVDEVLAVGDAAFQKKCLGKMGDVAKGGRTVLFVSHNMGAVSDLCRQGILLRNGRIIINDDVKKAVQSYLSLKDEILPEMQWSVNNAPGNEFVRLRKAYFLDADNIKIEFAFINQKFGFCVEYEVLKDLPFFTHGINVYNETETHLFTSHDDQKYEKTNLIRIGIYRTLIWIPANLLQSGDIEFSFACFRYDPFDILFHTQGIVRIKMIETINASTRNEDYRGGLPGLLRPKLNWDRLMKIG